jgi:hypothetical protein
MSDEKIAEIRARHAQSEKNYIELEATWKAQVHEDRAWLLAEVERLRGEMPVAESLRVDAKCAEIERDEARAVVWKQAKDNADLRAEVERLREVIRTIRARCVELDDSDAVSEVLDISSTALGDEP